jgi:transposase
VTLRSRIVVAAADGRPDSAIARELEVNRKTVVLWRARFAEEVIESLWEVAPGRGRKPRYGPEKIKAIVEATLQSKPKGMTQWSCRLMAERQGVSKSTISTIWRSHNLKPHRTKTFKLSRDPRFLEKLTDVVGLYLNPPQHALVLCVDEKTQIQALDRTQPGLPLKKGRCGTMTHDYKRNGTRRSSPRWRFCGRSSLVLQRHRHQESYAFPASDQEFPGTTPASGDGQLRHPPPSQGASVAGPASPVHSPLCADELELVEPGGALVRRTDVETNPAGVVREC